MFDKKLLFADMYKILMNDKKELEKRVERLEKDNKFLNIMLIFAFIHILVIVATK